jgi:hypothetical protein
MAFSDSLLSAQFKLGLKLIERPGKSSICLNGSKNVSLNIIHADSCLAFIINRLTPVTTGVFDSCQTMRFIFSSAQSHLQSKSIKEQKLISQIFFLAYEFAGSFGDESLDFLSDS